MNILRSFLEINYILQQKFIVFVFLITCITLNSNDWFKVGMIEI